MSSDFWSCGHLLAGCSGRSVSVWHLQNGAQVQQENLLADSEISAVQWTPNSKVLCFATPAGLQLYNGGAYLGCLPHENSPPCDMGSITCVRLTKDNRKMFVGSANSQIFVWDLKQQNLLSVLNHPASVTSVALDDEMIASSSATGKLTLHSMGSFQPMATLAQPDDHKVVHKCLSFSPLEAGILVSVSSSASSPRDSAVNLWSTHEGRQQHMKLPGGKHTDLVTGVSFSGAAAGVLVTCGVDRKVIVWDRRAPAASSAVQETVLGRPLTCLGIRDDGFNLAVGGVDGSVQCLDARNLSRPAGLIHCNEALPVVELHWQPSYRSKRLSAAASGTTAAAATTSATAGSSKVSAGGATGMAGSGTTPVSGVPTGRANGSMRAAGTGAPPAAAPAIPAAAAGPQPQPGRTSLSGRTAAASTIPSNSASLTNWLSGVTVDSSSTDVALPAPRSAPEAGAPPDMPGPTPGLHADVLTPSTRASAPFIGQAGGGGMPVPGHAVAVATAQQGLPTLAMPSSSQPNPAGIVSSGAAGLVGQKTMANGRGSDSGVRADAANMTLVSPSKSVQPSPASTGRWLNENTFRAVLDDAVAGIREDVRNLHVEVVRQFHMQQMDMCNLLSDVVARQSELQNDVRALKQQLERLTGQQAITRYGL